MKSPPMRLLVMLLLLGAQSVFADAPRDLNKLIPVQKAIAAARQAMQANEPAKALAILEAQQANGRGYSTYEQTLKEIRDTLSHAEKPRELPAALNPPIPPPPPVEEPIPTVKAPPERFPAIEPEPIIIRPTPAPTADVRPAVITPPRAEIDPFQQVPTHGKVATSDLSRADAAFAAKRYAQAATLYHQAMGQGLNLSNDQRDQHAYARLFVIAEKLKIGITDDSQRQTLLKEVAECRRSSSERMHDFCNRLENALQPTTPAATAEMAVNSLPTTATPQFVIRGSNDSPMNAEIVQVAHAARQAMYQRWTGADPNPWASPCEIVLHACGKDYQTTTKKPETLSHHATLSVRNGNIITRRLDLCIDDPHLLDITLPNELTQLILMELFAEQPLPKWALVGMGALSETPESVARYRRAVPQLLQDRKLLTLAVLLELQTFPEAEATTAFYAQSISLVSFLVEKKGCKAFVAFMREAPRRGYAKALQSHYGIPDPTELQRLWLKSLSGSKP